MTFLLRIRNQNSTTGMQISSLFTIQPFKFLFLCSTVKSVLYKYTESRQVEKPPWLAFHSFHMPWVGFWEIAFVLSQNLKTCSSRCRFCYIEVLKDVLTWMKLLRSSAGLSWAWIKVEMLDPIIVLWKVL